MPPIPTKNPFLLTFKFTGAQLKGVLSRRSDVAAAAKRRDEDKIASLRAEVGPKASYVPDIAGYPPASKDDLIEGITSSIAVHNMVIADMHDVALGLDDSYTYVVGPADLTWLGISFANPMQWRI